MPSPGQAVHKGHLMGLRHIVIGFLTETERKNFPLFEHFIRLGKVHVDDLESSVEQTIVKCDTLETTNEQSRFRIGRDEVAADDEA